MKQMYKNRFTFFVSLFGVSLWLVSSVGSQDMGGVIETVAGTGQIGCSGDNGPALQARFTSLSGLVVDQAGNVYIADAGCHTVRRLDRNGIITTVAGTGRFDFNGDRQPATLANLASPTGLTSDEVGNLYIADTGHHRIRKVDRNGIITTIAGTGEPSFNGDGSLASEVSLQFPADMAIGVAGGPGLICEAGTPLSECRRIVYIADTNNLRVRLVNSTGRVNTVAGNGLRGSEGDGGPAKEASFKDPVGVAVTAEGDLLIVDRSNHRIRRFDPRTGIITTVAGSGVFGFNGDDIRAEQAHLRLPLDVALDRAGNLYIADFWNHRIRRVDRNGIIKTVAGSGQGDSGDGGPATQASLNGPSAVAVDAEGNIYIADSMNHRVRVVWVNRSPR